eukprot:s2944_g4.t1
MSPPGQVRLARSLAVLSLQLKAGQNGPILLFILHCEEVVATPASLLSVPLTASLLGLRPSTAPDIPAGLRYTWPEVLLQRGEVCLADFAEEVKPNACLQWASAWPKLLWYIGAADARLTSFLLVLIIELSKATKPGGS